MAVKVLAPGRVEELKDAFIKHLHIRSDDLEALRAHLNEQGWAELIEEQRKHKVTPITAGRTEEQIAKEIRDDLQARLDAVGEIMTKVKREHGFTVSFGFSPPDSFGRISLAVLEITKKLC